MSTSWEVLCASGVPAGPPRPRPTVGLDNARVHAALGSLWRSEFEGLDQTMRECLLAWLSAFQHHWPERFSTTLGEAGRVALARLAHPAPDPNRYLKLRRIAIENLANAI